MHLVFQSVSHQMFARETSITIIDRLDYSNYVILFILILQNKENDDHDNIEIFAKYNFLNFNKAPPFFSYIKIIEDCLFLATFFKRAI